MFVNIPDLHLGFGEIHDDAGMSGVAFRYASAVTKWAPSVMRTSAGSFTAEGDTKDGGAEGFPKHRLRYYRFM